MLISMTIIITIHHLNHNHLTHTMRFALFFLFLCFSETQHNKTFLIYIFQPRPNNGHSTHSTFATPFQLQPVQNEDTKGNLINHHQIMEQQQIVHHQTLQTHQIIIHSHHQQHIFTTNWFKWSDAITIYAS